MEHQIYTKQRFITNDYDAFQKLVGNRKVTETRINKIVDSIKKLECNRQPFS